MSDHDVRRTPLDVWVLLLAPPVLIAVWRYHGQASGFPAVGGELDEFWRTLLQFGAFFLLFGLLPALDQRVRRRSSLRDAGLGLGDAGLGVRILAAGLPVMLLLAWLGASMPDVRAEYPLCRLLLVRSDLLAPYAAAYALLYYTAWEFFFRGYLLFGLAPRFGAAAAVLLQTVPSALAHLGKPGGEMFGSIPYGLVFGLIALRTRSVWYGWVLHAALGLATDFLVVRG